MEKISKALFVAKSSLKRYRLRPGEAFKEQNYHSKGEIHNFLVKWNFPTRGTRDDFMYEGTFHEAVGSIFAVAQLFGIMPVRGVKAKNPSKLKFNKCSFRFLLCLLYIAGTLWISILDVHWIATTKVEFGKLITLIYDMTNSLSLVCFLELARKWPKLMREWYKIEKSLPQIKYQLDKQKMAYEIKMVSLVVCFGSLSMKIHSKKI